MSKTSSITPWSTGRAGSAAGAGPREAPWLFHDYHDIDDQTMIVEFFLLS